MLEEGIGMSLINAVPEELIYASFRGIKVFLTQNDTRFQILISHEGWAVTSSISNIFLDQLTSLVVI